MVNRLLSEVNSSKQKSGLRDRIAAISANEQWEVSGRTNKTPAEECKAYKAYGEHLAKQTIMSAASTPTTNFSDN